MTPFSLYPAFVRIFYRTAFAPHTQTIPVYGWSPISGGHVAGTFLGADAAQHDAATYLSDYGDLIAHLWPATTTIGEAIIYTMAAPTGEAIPVASHDLANTGDNINPGWAEAVQLTFVMRTALLHKMKLEYLDVPSDNDFNKYTSTVGLSSAYTDILDYVMDPAGCFCGRDRGQPVSFVSMIHDLNDGLRERYRLT